LMTDSFMWFSSLVHICPDNVLIESVSFNDMTLFAEEDF